MNQSTIQALAGKWFIPTKSIIKHALKAKLHSAEKLELETFKNYFSELYTLKESTDHLIHGLITFPFVQPKLSIEEIFEIRIDSLNMPIHFVYGGDADWMDSTGSFRTSKKLQKSTFTYL